MNNGEIIAAILTAGVFDRLRVEGLNSMNADKAADAIVKCYGEVLNNLKEEHGEIFLPDHSKPPSKSNDTLGAFEPDGPRP